MTNPTSNYGWVLPTATDLVTDLPADFDVALQGVDTRLKALQPGTTLGDLAYSSATANTNTRLGIGTNGQVLSVSAGVPAWVTSADQTPLTTKGDVFTFTTVDARLGVGANDTVLTADSTQATGLKWATPNGMTLINTSGTTLSGASTTISSIPSGYNYIYGQIVGFRPATNAADLRVQFNGDTTSAYSWIGGSTFNQTSTKFTDGGCNSSSSNGNIQFQLPNYLATAWKFAQVDSLNVLSTATNNFFAQNYVSVWSGTGAITSMTFIPSTGNFTSGTVYLYGVK